MNSILEQLERKPEISFEDVKNIIESLRPVLFNRLESLENLYHNKKHAENVAKHLEKLFSKLKDPDLLNDKVRFLLMECALRHDDGHSGEIYRQSVFPEKLSNEEYAVQLLLDDLNKKIPNENIFLNFIIRHILSTTFGQTKERLLESKKPIEYKRDYRPKSITEKLLAFADVADFMDENLKDWLDESMLLYEEQGNSVGFEDWIEKQKNFLNYVRSLFENMESIFIDDFVFEVKNKITDFVEKLSDLNKDVIFRQRFNSINERIVKNCATLN